MAILPICSVEGCGKSAIARGWCPNHYARWKRNGSPTGGRTQQGVPLEWLIAECLKHSNQCVIWPFARNAAGYGKVSVEGRVRDVHRLVCELVHGEPSPGLEAAHSCGRTGCVNPRHLSWKSPIENARDKREHGTHPIGSSNAMAKLNEHVVADIRRLSSTLRQTDLAEMFNVTRSTVSGIIHRKTWKHVE